MIGIVDYGLGNLGSILNMFRKVGAEAGLASDPAAILAADRLVLPGVGAFDHGMRQLEQRGLLDALQRKVLGDRAPVLGVCLGMQLLGRRSEEGRLPGLGWIDAETVRFRFGDEQARLRTPHMGWNTLATQRPHPILAGLGSGARFYFVHSYHVICHAEQNTLATTVYGYPFTSAVVAGNIVGAQFHPEKSHRFGQRVFANFAEWTPGAEPFPDPAELAGIGSARTD